MSRRLGDGRGIEWSTREALPFRKSAPFEDGRGPLTLSLNGSEDPSSQGLLNGEQSSLDSSDTESFLNGCYEATEEHTVEEVRTLVDQLLVCERRREEALQHFEDRRRKCEDKQRKIRETLEEQAQVHESLTQSLQNVINPVEVPAIPPGPECLGFVETTAFMLLGLAVVLANVATMSLEVQSAHQNRRLLFLHLNRLFLLLYVAEFALKASLWKCQLLLGRPSRVWWNWLDLLIIVAGMFDMETWQFFIMNERPDAGVLVHQNVSNFSSNVDDVNVAAQGGDGVAFCQLIRLARLLRLVKLAKLVLTADLTWAEEEWFQRFIMGVIGASCLLMGLEDYYPDGFPACNPWPLLEDLVLAIFVFELVARLKNRGFKKFFCDTSDTGDLCFNLLDLVIVVGGIAESWLPRFISFIQALMGQTDTSQNEGAMGDLLITLRMFRLLRVLRLVRLLRNTPALYVLLKGTAEAFVGIAWVVLLVFLVLYSFSLIMTELVTLGLLFDTHPDKSESWELRKQVLATFSSVWETMFVLFEVMNGHVGVCAELFKVRPEFRFFFAIWVVISSWAILAILTSVVSENMIKSVMAYREAEEERLQESQDMRRKLKLHQLFDRIDMNGDGEVQRSELDEMIDKVPWFWHAAGLEQDNPRSVEQIMHILDHESSVNRHRFVEVLFVEQRHADARTLMRLEKNIVDLHDRLKSLQQVAVSSRQQLHSLKIAALRRKVLSAFPERSTHGDSLRLLPPARAQLTWNTSDGQMGGRVRSLHAQEAGFSTEARRLRRSTNGYE